MSDRRWIEGLATGLVLGTAVSLIFLVWSVPEFRSIESAQDHYINWKSASSPTIPHNTSDSHFWLSEFRGWIYIEDSLAQWLMFIVGAGATLISLSALHWLKRTWIEAERAADAAVSQLLAARVRDANELRAYLSVEPLGIRHLIGNQSTKGHVLVKNVGRLPAKNVSIIVRMKMCERDEWRPDDCRLAKPSSRTIHPDATMSQGSIADDDILAKCVLQKSGYIFVWGIVEYLDGYDNLRYTRFCHRYARASHDRSVDRATASREGLNLINADKARYHETGNEAS